MEGSSIENQKDAEMYVDVKFESMVDEVEERLKKLQSEVAKKSPHVEESVKDVCRGIRQAKFQFAKVLQSYGTAYQGQAQHFVDLAYSAADMAHGTGFSDVTESLQRHAKEIHAARVKVQPGESARPVRPR